MEQSISSRKGQIVTIDFILGFTLILIAIVLSVSIILTTTKATSFGSVRTQGVVAAESLMSEGAPINWTPANVYKVGILSDGILNQSKLNQVLAMNYSAYRPSLTGNYQLYVYFTNGSSVMNLGACGFGSPEVTVNATCDPQLPLSADQNIVRLNRLVAYNNSIVVMVVMVWD